MAVFALCCHAATLLPRSETPFCKGLPKDPWQRGSKITKKKFFFSSPLGPSLMAPYSEITQGYSEIRNAYFQIRHAYYSITQGYLQILSE